MDLMLAPILLMEGETGYQAIITALQGAISVSAITPIIVAGMTAALVFVIFWFGIRKVTSIFMAGFRKGRVSTG